MKKSDIFGVLAVVATWCVICIIGILEWKTKTDMYQGIILGFGILGLVFGFNALAGETDEYDEYGDYKQRY